MKEAFEQSVEELKRVDHLFYVSLKYTRTVDVIKNVISRLINCFEFGFESVLKHAKEKKALSSIPANIGLKCELLRENYPNDIALHDYINFFFLLKKIMRAQYTKKEEYRRHVAMIATLDNNEILEVNIDLLKQYYDKTREFVGYVSSKINEETNN